MSRAGSKRPLEALESPIPELQQSENRVNRIRDPKISKTVTACTECQKRKIKCDLGSSGDICTRCSKKNLQCIVNKNLQSLLKDEAQWKRDIENDASTTRGAVSEILKVLNLPPLDAFRCPSSATSRNATSSNDERLARTVRFASVESPANTVPSQRVPAAMAMTRENSQEPEEDEPQVTAIVTDPMGSLYEVTKLRNLRSKPQSRLRQRYTPSEGDFISSGKVSLEDAGRLFDHFSNYLNAYLWGGIALVHPDLMAVRCSSSLLLAAILAVSALHLPGMEAVFDVCYAEFVGLICDSMLDRYHTMDGIRGLSIGAFWLSDLSWKLSGHAVRIATELNLHQSYSKAVKGSSGHLEGARLWLLLYVCDHHFSIAYGRPPVIHESRMVLNHIRLLQLPQVTQADERLHSQVAIFIILTDIYNMFGPDNEEQLREEDFNEVNEFNQRLDQYHLDWQPRLTSHRYIGSYPTKGVDLHCHYAKLQLNSLVLRRLSSEGTYFSPRRSQLAGIAVSSAIMILRMTLDEPAIRDAIVGVPLYVHTMITYATVFLLKVYQRWGTQLGMDIVLVQDLITRVMGLLRASKASGRHLAYHIASGLGGILSRFAAHQHVQASEPRIPETSANGCESAGINTAEFDPVASYTDMIDYDHDSGVITGLGQQVNITRRKTSDSRHWLIVGHIIDCITKLFHVYVHVGYLPGVLSKALHRLPKNNDVLLFHTLFAQGRIERFRNLSSGLAHLGLPGPHYTHSMMTDERTMLLQDACLNNAVLMGDVEMREALQKYIPDTEEEKKLLRKIDLRLMPVLWIMYILNFMDRTNIGNAKIAGMSKDLDLDDSRYAWALGVFFIGYLMMEVPSNMLLSRSRPSIFLPTIMLVWGALSTAMAGIHSYGELLAFRFVLGCIEAGFFPGVLYLLSCWYKPAEIGKRFAIFFSASVLAGAFGGLLAGAITQNMAGSYGIAAWRWLFIIEGLATVCVSLVAKFILFDFPSTSLALSPAERQLATIRLLAAGVESSSHDDGDRLNHWQSFIATVADYRTFLFMFLCICTIGAATISYFIPTIILALGYETVTAQYMTTPVYIIAAIFLNIAAVSADRLQERRWHVTGFLTMGFVAAIVCIFVINPIIRYIMLCFLVAGIWTSIPLVFAWMSEVINIPAEKRAVCLALVNSMANLSSIYGSRIWPSNTAPQYTFGWSVTAGFLGCAVFMAALLPVILTSIPPHVTKAGRDIQDRNDAVGVEARGFDG